MKVSLLVCFFVLGSASVHAQLVDFRHSNFKKADSIADACSGQPVTDLPSLSARLTSHLTRDEEKFRALYKWVCNNIEFDYELFRINREKRDKFDSPDALLAWNKKLTPLVYRNLVLQKKTVCTGYAWLVQQLAHHAGIRCVIVDGYGRNATASLRKSGKANHSWNAVQLDGKWYLCDATWASGAYDADREMFIKNYDDAYFLADPEVFIRNHYPLDARWTLLASNQFKPDTKVIEPDTAISDPEVPTLHQFLNGPLTYSSVYEHHVTRLHPETFDLDVVRNEAVNFHFASEQAIECIELSVRDANTTESVRPAFSKNEAGLYAFDHAFVRRGRYVVHVLLNTDYAFTYVVTVR